jgi:secondary thiamine-phosphate synthase enzyme
MNMMQYRLEVATKGRGFYNITDQLTACLSQAAVKTGLCHVFLHHTSASLTLCENADPLVQRDLEAFMTRLTPDGDPLYQHTMEGPDDMSAHVRTILTQSFLILPITNGQLALGRWQSAYLWEHRLTGYQRQLTVTIYGS